jgi:3-methyladenine DNA glycosylase Tag
VEGAPPQFTARTLDDYLEHLSKPVFQAGISWRVVDAKWAGIAKAFHGFKVERVARMSEREIDALTKDERVIRSRPKIAAVVHNANALLELERAGGFKKHLRSFSEYEDLATDLKKRFKFVGDSGVYRFLWTVKQPVPEWHAWAKAHGMDDGGRHRAAPKRAARRPAATSSRSRPRAR